VARRPLRRADRSLRARGAGDRVRDGSRGGGRGAARDRGCGGAGGARGRGERRGGGPGRAVAARARASRGGRERAADGELAARRRAGCGGGDRRRGAPRARAGRRFAARSAVRAHPAPGGMMSVVIVVGAQWGDEGKGKVVDLFTERADVVVRYGGGANAGHTLVIEGKKLVTHLVPSGVCHPGKSCVLGDGMVIDPHTLLDEIAECQERGLLIKNELLVGLGAHVILPYHKLVDGLREDHGAKRGKAIGTTRRGIGPAYEMKAARRGVRMRDLLKPERLRNLVGANLEDLAAVIQHLGGTVPGKSEIDQWIDDALAAGERLRPHTGEAG